MNRENNNCNKLIKSSSNSNFFNNNNLTKEKIVYLRIKTQSHFIKKEHNNLAFDNITKKIKYFMFDLLIIFVNDLIKDHTIDDSLRIKLIYKFFQIKADIINLFYFFK